MSHKLIESILDKNFVLAENHLHDRLNTIREQKLLEVKKQVAAQMDEVLGGRDPKELRAKGYVRASAPKEQGGLGLSPYDRGKEEAKKKAAEREKKAKAKHAAASQKAEPKAAEPSAAPEVKLEPEDIKNKTPKPETPKTPKKSDKESFAKRVKSSIGSGLAELGRYGSLAE